MHKVIDIRELFKDSCRTVKFTERRRKVANVKGVNWRLGEMSVVIRPGGGEVI